MSGRRLYNQLDEVKLRKEEEDRKAAYALNREKRKEYEKVNWKLQFSVLLSIDCFQIEQFFNEEVTEGV